MEQTTIKKRSKTAICSKGTMAFIIDFKTTCKPEKFDESYSIGYMEQVTPHHCGHRDVVLFVPLLLLNTKIWNNHVTRSNNCCILNINSIYGIDIDAS